jgi:sulfur relay (sulfurtransferase) complex TusBCD TusD component (DsrE family)
MTHLKSFFAVLLTAIALIAPMAHAQDADVKSRGLFVNLTTDDTWSAAKAISFAHEKALKNGHSPVAIWLNVRGVYLADKKRPSHVHGLKRAKDQSVQDMLAAFMADGGQVIMCSACSAAAGLTQEDYIDGVTMGTWPVVEGLLFNPDVTTLAW